MIGTGWNAPRPNRGFEAFSTVWYAVPSYGRAAAPSASWVPARVNSIEYRISAADSVIVVPLDFARPAGLRLSASPSSADAIAAPARDVETAPEPGRNSPPAWDTAGAARRLARNV